MQTVRDRGFTLVELLIVVAVVGILASLAIPNFTKFRARAKQAEAKTNLRAAAQQKVANYSEQDTVVCHNDCFCGWSISGNLYSYSCNDATDPEIFPGLVAQTFTSIAGQTSDACVPVAPPAGNDDEFGLTATGNIDIDALCDLWGINHRMRLTHEYDDIGNWDMTE